MSLNGENVHKTGHFKDLLNGLVHMANHHIPLFVHGLLSGQQYPQAGGGQVFQVLKIKLQIGDALQGAFQFPLQLGSGGGVQAALQSQGQLAAVLDRKSTRLNSSHVD